MMSAPELAATVADWKMPNKHVKKVRLRINFISKPLSKDWVHQSIVTIFFDYLNKENPSKVDWGCIVDLLISADLT